MWQRLGEVEEESSARLVVGSSARSAAGPSLGVPRTREARDPAATSVDPVHTTTGRHLTWATPASVRRAIHRSMNRDHLAVKSRKVEKASELLHLRDTVDPCGRQRVCKGGLFLGGVGFWI